MTKEKILEKIMGQMNEDREVIYETFKDLKIMANADPTTYAINGMTMAKFAELMTKQTAQVIDLLKIESKEQKPDDNLDDEDLDYINKSIDNKQ